MFFFFYGDFSILRNRDNNVSKFGNTDFRPLVGMIKISGMQNIHIPIRPLWTNPLSQINLQLSTMDNFLHTSVENSYITSEGLNPLQGFSF